MSCNVRNGMKWQHPITGNESYGGSNELALSSKQNQFSVKLLGGCIELIHHLQLLFLCNNNNNNYNNNNNDNNNDDNNNNNNNDNNNNNNINIIINPYKCWLYYCKDN